MPFITSIGTTDSLTEQTSATALCLADGGLMMIIDATA
jgi:hypothetical protein